MEYKKKVWSWELDKDRIKEDLAMGIEITGATLVKSSTLRKYVNKSK